MEALAKLSRPRLAGICPRERLFARLDECRRHPAVWIAGPPGAGKTTLAASYLDARKLPALWYQVDAGDADPASFFYHLGLGARQAGLSRKTHLPLLTPEYRVDLPGFTRRYFRALCQGLPQRCVLVLDNYQDAPEASPFDALIRDALAEIPQGTNAILVSRGEPPAVHARLRASQAIAEIGWDELRLTEEEAAQIAATARRARTDGIGALVERCGGWAAGLTLLLDHAGPAGGAAEAPESRQTLFDYFAAELFDRLPHETRHLLLRTALLPWVGVEMAQALSGNAAAGTLLEGLRREHLFTERRAGTVASYKYHPLLREFLAGRVDDACTPAERRHLARQSAQLLADADEPGAALPLYLAAGDHEAAVRLVLAHAPSLAAQGRLQTLAGWIGALPVTVAEAVPWIAYWLGACEFGTSLPTARAHLESAFERFGELDDTLGQAVAAAGVVESHNVEFRNFTLLDPWIAQLQRLLDRGPAFPDPALELNVVGSLLGALVMRTPTHGLLAPYFSRVRSLVDRVTDINSRIAGASRLLHCCVFLHETRQGGQLIESIRPLLHDPQLSANSLCTWLGFQALYFQLCRYDAREAQDAMDAALDIMERHGLHHWAILLRSRAAMLRLELGDVQGAAAHLAHTRPAIENMRFDMAWYNGLHAWLALLRGDHSAAVLQAELLVRDCARAGAPHPHGMALMMQANALAAVGDHEQAAECLQQCREGYVVQNWNGNATISLIEADLHVLFGDPAAARVALHSALAIGRQERLFNTLHWLAPQMSRLCAFALEHGIEPEYVTELIRVRGLLPPSADTQTWPWPVKVHTLGRFEILKDDLPLRAEGKTQRKPLALLKALIALGGTEVPEDKLFDIVWAESLAGSEQKAFDVTLHRLRKLLGNDKALRVTDRRVSLNREVVWVDLWALEHQLSAATSAAQAGLPDVTRLESAAPTILNLYRGHFLDGEADSAWLLPVRNRLGGRFQRFVIRLGEHWEGQRQWSRAEGLYQRAVELDPLAEPFYCRLMVCLREQGRRVEAVEVFRRCRQLLSVTLGVKPAEATEAVYRELLGS